MSVASPRLEPPSRASAAYWGLVRRARPYGWALFAALLVAAYGVLRIVARAGEPALPLDDAYIHLQYARRLAEGHWFSYTEGQGYTSGATSLIWPLLLAPYFLLGGSGLGSIWLAWLLGALFFAGLVLETARIAAPLAGRAGGIAAALMCLSFGAFAWFSLSGMETIAFSWVLLRGLRVACERLEPGRRRFFSAAQPAGASQLAILGLLAPLLRPEGMLVSLMAVLVAGALALRRRGDLKWALVPLFGPLIIPAMHFVFTGQAASSTATVKWFALDPYLDRLQLVSAVAGHVRLLVTDLLAGGPWTGLFLPEFFVVPLGLGMLAMLFAARRERRWGRALLILLVACGALLTCTYATMLWNRVRYIWPFAPAWFICVACLTSQLGRFAARLRPGLALTGPALSGAMVATLAIRLPSSVDDLATSARAIHFQQVALGRWAAKALPKQAVIGVNDTGAIAFLSGRRTFDVVGLTSEGEARYWAEGVGSRFEHYERLGGERLPTHFIVYPGWMRMPSLLGEVLTQATVRDQSILGGATMVAYRARYDSLGSGAEPFPGQVEGSLIDELDVADLSSESAHHYRRGASSASLNLLRAERLPSGQIMVDGGRGRRHEDRFAMAASGPAVLVFRAASETPLEVWVGSERMADVARVFRGAVWDEQFVALPAASSTRWITVRSASLVPFTSYHYWLYPSATPSAAP